MTAETMHGRCYGCARDREVATRYTHGAKLLCDECAARPHRKPTAEGLDRVEPPTSFPKFLPSHTEAQRWPVLAPEAYHGLAGDFTRGTAPRTEADPAAVLLTFLTTYGAAVGPNPYVRVADVEHHPRTYALVVGKSSSGAKGTSWGVVSRVFRVVDPDLISNAVGGGLASGEGLVQAAGGYVDDDDVDEGKEGTWGPKGPPDPLLILEAEFAGLLHRCGRDGSTLSAMLRALWDDGTARNRTRRNSLRVDQAHVSIVGHITPTELRSTLTTTEIANGLANRFLFAVSRRSKSLPNGESTRPEVVRAMADRIADALLVARDLREVTLTDSARLRIALEYERLRNPDVDGMLDDLLARGIAHVYRLALTYALVDGTGKIDVPHVDAAFALWQYCHESAVYLFAGQTGDPKLDAVAELVARSGPDGVDRKSILRQCRTVKAADLDNVRDQLLAAGLVDVSKRPTTGRPVEVWTKRVPLEVVA